MKTGILPLVPAMVMFLPVRGNRTLQHQDRLSQRTIHAISPDPEELPVKQTEDDHGQLGFRPIGHRDILMHELDLDPPYAARPAP